MIPATEAQLSCTSLKKRHWLPMAASSRNCAAAGRWSAARDRRDQRAAEAGVRACGTLHLARELEAEV
jgi:hypothetical protein